MGTGGKTYGPHTVDLMAADCNAMTDRAGEPLRHFTPCPMPRLAGVDLCAQYLKEEVNCYVFPPFGMIFPVLAFLREQRVSGCTCVLPDFQPRPQWFPWKVVRFHLLCWAKKAIRGGGGA